MSNIRFRLDLDGKPFADGLKNAEKRGKAFGAAMDDVGSKLKRQFGAGDMFKGLMQGLGIGSAERIAELIVSPWKKAAEYAKQLAEYSTKATDATLKLMSLRRTDEQNLAVLKREQAKLQRQAVGFNGRDLSDEEKTEAARVNAALAEKALEAAELETKIKEKNAATQRENDAARLAYEESIRATDAALLKDEEKLTFLAEERFRYLSKAADASLDMKERYEAAAKAEQAAKEIALTKKKIEEDRAKAAEEERKEKKKAAEQEKKDQAEIRKATKEQKEARAELKKAKEQQFTFTLGEAASGTRGGPAARQSSRLIEQKTQQMQTIADRGGYDVVYGESGPQLVSKDPQKRDAAEQASGRFRKLYADREALRGSIGNLADTDRNPFAAEIKQVERATMEVKEVLEEIRDRKFANQ